MYDKRDLKGGYGGYLDGVFNKNTWERNIYLTVCDLMHTHLKASYFKLRELSLLFKRKQRI